MNVLRISVHMADNEWSADENYGIMQRIAREQMDEHAQPDTLVVVVVYEHAGWWLTYAKNKAGDIIGVGSANDMAEYYGEAAEIRQLMRNGKHLVGFTVRREVKAAV